MLSLQLLIIKKNCMLFIFDKNGYVYKIELDNEVTENTNWFGN